MKAGVLGGTFDPVHYGHLRIAEEARQACNLREVVFVPAARPWMKERPISPAKDRWAMLELALAGRPYFRLSPVDIERGGETYTIDTITDLRARMGERDDLYFILGWDSLAMLPHWRQAAKIVELCYLVAAPRPGYGLPDLANLEENLPGVSGKVILLEKPCVAVSATDIRRRAARGESLKGLVPDAVAVYIAERRLYEKFGAEGGI